ncbi:MAG: HAAS signaling domain-containing protein [Thomasclavelia ramosa]
MQYYEDYFDEAGPENEQQVINDLGSPERVAAIIKAGLDNQFDQDIEYSEKGMDNSNYKQSREIIDAKIISEEETAADDNNDYQNNKRHKNNFRGNSDRNRILLIFIIIGAVF